MAACAYNKQLLLCFGISRCSCSVTLSSSNANMHLRANRASLSLSGVLSIDVIPEERGRTRRRVMLWVSALVNLSLAYNITCLLGCFALSSLMPACLF